MSRVVRKGQWSTAVTRAVFDAVMWSPQSARAILPQVHLAGDWADKYWKNIPGPFYSTRLNSRSLAAFQAQGDASNIAWDEECEFVWRQPGNDLELSAVLDAIGRDETLSYQGDGNSRWTRELVRLWWAERARLVNLTRAQLRELPDDRQAYREGRRVGADHALLREMLRFILGEAETYLRKYCYFLEERREPGASVALPDIG